MTVEGRRGSMGRDGGSRDHFPVGMRVLAVDDDPTCLMLLEGLLRRCQYHVTATNQAITALKLLRENKDKFDLVISDVHMPDMDGFKLLELVGLEMDLPVIMLSANGETAAVMKGITHGACDYLLKPVRIEELKNIWQHVIRRKKFEPRIHSGLDDGEDSEKPQNVNSEGRQGPATSGSSDHNGKFIRKRKDQDEEDEEDCEDNNNENEDPSAQKKPRVVWSVELHHKFVAAVKQLGIDKAVPKRILDLMNVERLTRENVASHLQKYRLYLKRLSAVASQQANMAAALGARDPSYLAMNSLNGFGNYHPLMRPGQLPALTSFQSSGVLSRSNSSSGLGYHGLAPSGIVQFGRTQNNVSNPINDISKLQRIGLPGNQHGGLLQGMPTSLELDQLRQHKMVPEASSSSAVGFSVSGLGSGCSHNSFLNVANNSLLLQSQQQQMQSRGLGSHSSANLASLSSDPFEINLDSASHLPDLERCSDAWPNAGPLTGFSVNSLPTRAPFANDTLASNSMGENIAPIVSHPDNHLDIVSSSNMAATPLHDALLGKNVQCQANLLGGNMMLMPTVGDQDPKMLSFRTPGNSRQKWDEQTQDQICNPNLLNTSSSSSFQNHSMLGTITENQKMNSGFCNSKAGMNMISQSNFGTPGFTPQCLNDKSTADGQLKFKDDFHIDTSKFQGGLSSTNCSFDDSMNGMMKPITSVEKRGGLKTFIKCLLIFMLFCNLMAMLKYFWTQRWSCHNLIQEYFSD